MCSRVGPAPSRDARPPAQRRPVVPCRDERRNQPRPGERPPSGWRKAVWRERSRGRCRVVRRSAPASRASVPGREKRDAYPVAEPPGAERSRRPFGAW